MPSHYLNHCWNIVNLTLGNKLQWNLNRNEYIFIQDNAFENVVWKMAAISLGLNMLKLTTETCNTLWRTYIHFFLMQKQLYPRCCFNQSVSQQAWEVPTQTRKLPQNTYHLQQTASAGHFMQLHLIYILVLDSRWQYITAKTLASLWFPECLDDMCEIYQPQWKQCLCNMIYH